MTVREILEQYKVADKRAKRLKLEYEKEKMLIDAIKSPLGSDGMPHGNEISKTVEVRALKLIEKGLNCQSALLDAIIVRQKVFDLIMNIDGIENDVLYEYYIEYYDEKKCKPKTWQDVADIVHVDVRTVYRLKRKAFEKLSVYVSKFDDNMSL